MTAGPFESESQVLALPGVRAIFEAFDADPGPGKMAPHIRQMLLGALEAAGVDLGSPSSFDRQVAAGLANHEAQVVAVIGEWAERAFEFGRLAGRHNPEGRPEVIHRCPPEGSGVMPCCDRTPLQVPPWHRLTLDPSLVTCKESTDD